MRPEHALESLQSSAGYDAKRLLVVVRDDGVGIDPQALEASSPPGHWGLVGMQERTASIGGHLETSTQRGMDTTVRLIVPSGIAYARSCQLRASWLKRRFRRRVQEVASRGTVFESDIGECPALLDTSLYGSFPLPKMATACARVATPSFCRV